MRRLIINADDLGINPQRSHGIFQCQEFGVVTNASLIANGSDSDAAARRARERGVPTGLHLNLTEEEPLSKPDDVPGLVEMNGTFFDRLRLRAALDAGTVPERSLEREIRAQVEWFFDAHGNPTHVDGHHHIHIHPAVIEALIPILERYGIRSVRIPCEEPLPPFGYEIPEEQLLHTRALNELAKNARERYTGQGILTTDHFRGATLVGNASLKNIRHVLSKLPEGTTELMVHPGSPCTFGTPFDIDPQRQTEMRMLLDSSIAELLAEKKVELISYADL
ncbi:MAG: ChbG/HpnK family deacetylase [Candidatus Peregrinibacteria bacterium]|nr:ChbG/HpnK family deacetylase [Candidatus Peregrinibacteria bacterium]